MANLAKICHAFGQRLSENLKKITRGTPCKVAKLMGVANMTKVPPSMAKYVSKYGQNLEFVLQFTRTILKQLILPFLLHIK